MEANKTIVSPVLDLLFSSGSLGNLALQDFILDCFQISLQLDRQGTKYLATGEPEVESANRAGPPPKRRKLNFDESLAAQGAHAYSGNSREMSIQAFRDRLVDYGTSVLSSFSAPSNDFIAREAQSHDFVSLVVLLDTILRIFVIWNRQVPTALGSLFFSLIAQFDQYFSSLDQSLFSSTSPTTSVFFAVDVVLRFISHLLVQSAKDPTSTFSVISVKESAIARLLQPFFSLLAYQVRP